MPFIKRLITVDSENGRSLPSSLCGEFDAFSNAALANVLRQLGSLMQHASDIFQGLEQECMVTFTRSQQIKAKIWSLEETIEDLDHKTEKIRDLDLKAFEKISQHYEAKQVSESGHFTVEDRPSVVKDVYSAAQQTPAVLLKRFDDTTPDEEVPPSAVFHLMPVVTVPYTGIQEEVHVEKTTTHVFATREYRQSKIRRRPQSTYSVQSDVDSSTNIEPDLPSLEELTLKNALSVPSCVVEVDTDGSGFDRMCNLRRSQRESLYSSLPSLKRRQTISGAREDYSTKRNTPYTCSVRQKPWTMQNHDRAVSNPVIVDHAPQISTEPDPSRRFEQRPHQKKQKTMSRLRRALSFSKLKTKSTEELPQPMPNRLSCSPLQPPLTPLVEKEEKKDKKSKRFSWLPNFLKKSKSKKNLSVPRSKSDNFDKTTINGPIEARPQSQEILENSKMDPMQYKISKRYAFSMPDVSDAEDLPVRQLAGSPLAVRHKGKSPEPAYADPQPVVMRRGRSQSNSTHRLSFQRRSVVLLANSKLMDTAVALRDSNGAIHRDDHHSSSGNWSGSSDSTRKSMESDIHKQMVDSRASLDSALSMPHGISRADRYHSLPAKNSVRGPHFIKEGSDSWALDVHNKVLTQNNLRFHNTINGNIKNVDDDASTYSEDEDGFFTSMRLDSGLKRSQSVSITSPSSKEVIEADEPRRCISVQIFDKKSQETLNSNCSLSGSENISSQSASTTSNTSIDSVIYVPLRSSVNPYGKIGSPHLQNKAAFKYISESDFKRGKEYDPTKKSSVPMDMQIRRSSQGEETKSKKAKPPPPVRKSSLVTIKSNKESTDNGAPNTHSKDVNNGEPHEEVYARIKSKTHISASKFPSTVSISPNHSDDESELVLKHSASFPYGNCHVGNHHFSTNQRPSSADNLLDVKDEYCYGNGEGGYDYTEHASTLPRSLKKKGDCRSLSWPRRPKKTERPGILKTGEKENGGMRQSKTLNFATHVNYIERTPPTSPEMNTILRRPIQDKACFVHTEPYRKPFIYLPDPVTSMVKITKPQNNNVPTQSSRRSQSPSGNNQCMFSSLVPVDVSQSRVESRNRINRSSSLNVPNSKSIVSQNGRCFSEARVRQTSQESVSSVGLRSSSSGTLCDEVFGSSEMVTGRLSRTSSGNSLPRRRSRPQSTSPYNSLTRRKTSTTSIPEEVPEKYMPTIRVKAGNKKDSSENIRAMPMYGNPAQLTASNSKSSDSLSSTTSGLSNSSGSTQTSGVLIRTQRSNSVNVRANPILVTPLPRPVSEFIPKDNDKIEIAKKSGSKSSEHLPSFNLIRDIPDCITVSNKSIDSTIDRKSYYEKVYGSYVPPFLQRSVSENNGWKRSSISSCDSGVGSEDKNNGLHTIQRSISENGPYDTPSGITCGGPITIAVEVHSSNTLTKSNNNLNGDSQKNKKSSVITADPLSNSKQAEHTVIYSKPVTNGSTNHQMFMSTAHSAIVENAVAKESEMTFSRAYPPATKNGSVRTNIEHDTEIDITSHVTDDAISDDVVMGYKPVVGLKTTILPYGAAQNGDQKKPSYLLIGQSGATQGFGYKRPGSFSSKK